MIPMRRCTSVIVMDGAPRAAGCCRWAAAGPESTASSSARRYRIAFRGLEVGEAKPNAPDRGGLQLGALALLCRSRLASLELGFGARLLLWGLTLRFDPRLTTRWGSLAARLGAPWRRVSAPPLFRNSSALWLRRRLHWLLGPVGLIRPVAPLGTPGLVAVIGLVRPVPVIGLVGSVAMLGLVRSVAMIGLVGPVPTIGLVGPVPTIGLVGPTLSAAIVVPLGLGAWATPGRQKVGRRDDARPAQITTPHADVAAAIVVHRPLAHPRNEGIRRLSVLEDEPGLRPVGACEDDSRVAVVPIRVVVRIVEDHDPEAHTGVIVGAPGRVAHVRVAVVAQEPGIVVVLLDVVRRDVVIPIVVAVRHDALCQLGEGDVRVAADAPVGDRPIVPVLPTLDAVVDERVSRRDGEHVADTRIVIDVERIAAVSTLHLVIATAAGEVVLPRFARKQHAHPAVGVDAQDGNEGVPVGAEMHANALAAGVGTVAPVGPGFDARAIVDGHGPDRGACGLRGYEAEQPDGVQHGASMAAVRGQVACQPDARRQRR